MASTAETLTGSSEPSPPNLRVLPQPPIGAPSEEKPSLANRAWAIIARKMKIASQITRATRIGIPKLPGIVSNRERAASLFRSSRILLREGRKEGETSVAERVLGEKQTLRTFVTMLDDMGITPRELVSIVAPDQAKYITSQKIKWKEVTQPLFNKRRSRKKVPKALRGTISLDFYQRIQKVVGKELTKVGVTILGILDEESLSGALMAIGRVEDDIEGHNEEFKDAWTRLLVGGAIQSHLKGSKLAALGLNDQTTSSYIENTSPTQPEMLPQPTAPKTGKTINLKDLQGRNQAGGTVFRAEGKGYIARYDTESRTWIKEEKVFTPISISQHAKQEE